MNTDIELIERRLEAKERQVAVLVERVRKLDVSGTIRHSILNCVNNPKLRHYFDDAGDVDGLTAIMDKLVSIGIRKMGLESDDPELTIPPDVDGALRIFDFLFKYSFSQVPSRVETLHGNIDRDNVDLDGKLERLRLLKDVTPCS